MASRVLVMTNLEKVPHYDLDIQKKDNPWRNHVPEAPDVLPTGGTGVYRVHALKCQPPFFEDVLIGAKTFELRLNDRDFKLGDVLHLQEYMPDRRSSYQEFTGRWLQVEVSYVQYKGFGGLADGFVILGLGPVLESGGRK